MNLIGIFVKPASALFALALLASIGQAALITYPVENWAAQTQSAPPTSASDGSNSPTFTPAENAMSILGRYNSIELKNDGDYLHARAELTLGNRSTNTGLNILNTILRFGVFNGPDAAVTTGDGPNHGVFIVYGNHNQTANRRIRYNSTASTTSIFPVPADHSNSLGSSGTDDTDLDSLHGANVGPVLFELKFTRNSDLLDIFGKISGTDSATGRPYISEYNFTGFDPGIIGFEFDRAGFFFGSNVDAANAKLTNVTVETNVPEPGTVALAALALLGGIASTRRVIRRA